MNSFLYANNSAMGSSFNPRFKLSFKELQHGKCEQSFHQKVRDLHDRPTDPALYNLMPYD